MADWKDHVRLATTTSLSPFPPTTLVAVDGVTPLAGDRVLVKNQTDATQNGIWLAQSGTWSRAADADGAGEIEPEMAVRVSEGAANEHTEWTLNTQGTITPGTTALQFRDANLLMAEVALDDTQNTLTIAGGRRYVVPDATLTTSRRRIVASAGAVPGDRMVIRSEETGRHHLRLLSENTPIYCIATLTALSRVELYFDGTEWINLTPAGQGWFNVRDFGARGDEDESVAGAIEERKAIQAAFDAANETLSLGTAGSPLGGDQRGATVFFPRGTYVVDRAIVVPRGGASGHIRILGEGQDATTLSRSRESTRKVVNSSIVAEATNVALGIYIGGSLTFTSTGAQTGTITRTSGDFVAEGWKQGDQVIVRGTVLNNTGRALLPVTSRDPLTVVSVTPSTGPSTSILTVSGDVVGETADYPETAIQMNAPVLAPEPDPTIIKQGVWTIEQMSLRTEDSSVLWYNFGDVTDLVNSSHRPSIAMRDVTLVVSAGAARVPAVFLQFGQRCSFERVRGVGAVYGVVIEYRAGSFGLFTDVGIEGLPGPCVYMTQGKLGDTHVGGGSHLLLNCRSDGAYRKPELWLHDQKNVTIIGYTTEGKQATASCHAKDCRQLTIIGGSMGGAAIAWSETKHPTVLTFHAATKTITRTVGSFIDDGWTAGQTCSVSGTTSNDDSTRPAPLPPPPAPPLPPLPLTVTAVAALTLTVAEVLVDETAALAGLNGSRHGDALLLENCHNVSLENTAMAPNDEAGDQSARTVRIVGASTSVHLRPHISTSDMRPSIDIDPTALSCSVLGNTGDSTGIQPIGPTEVDRFRIWHDFFYVGYHSVGYSSSPNGNYVGLIAKRTAQTQTALVFDETLNGWTTGIMDNETTFNGRTPFYASSYRGELSGAVRIQAGSAENIYFAQSTAGDDSTSATFATWSRYVPGTSVILTLASGYSFRPTSDSFWESTFSSYDLRFSSGSSSGAQFVNAAANKIRFAVRPNGVAIGAGIDFGGGVNALSWQEASTTPASAPAGYQVLWVDKDDGKLKAYEPNGVRTTLVPRAAGSAAGVVLDRAVAARLDTTDATVTLLASYSLPASTVAVLEVEVVGYVTGGSSGTVGRVFAGRRRIVAKNVSGTCVVVGTPDTVGVDANEETLGGITVTSSSADVQVKVTGKVDVAVKWNAELRVLSAT